MARQQTADPYKSKLHRDGTASVWNVYRQDWQRLESLPDMLAASLSPKERERVTLHLETRKRTGTILTVDFVEIPEGTGDEPCYIEAQIREWGKAKRLKSKLFPFDFEAGAVLEARREAEAWAEEWILSHGHSYKPQNTRSSK